MGVLQNKIDFEGIIVVENANCNGDPLNGNMPRVTYEGYGEMSDVCIKRKIRNRLLDAGENIFVQSDDKCIDKCKSLKARAEANEAFGAELKKGKKADAQRGYEIACKEWMDVRSFGQVFAFKGSDLSLGIRGPVSVQPAFSVDPIDITSMQITKSVNSEAGKEGKASDTMGTKHRIGFGLYVVKGSVNVQLAEKTGFSQEDAELLKDALKTLFENDAFYKNAKKANEFALQIQNSLHNLGYPLLVKGYTNQVFPALTLKQYDFLKEYVSFEIWDKRDDYIIVRFVTSFSTTQEEVNELSEYLKQAAKLG